MSVGIDFGTPFVQILCFGVIVFGIDSDHKRIHFGTPLASNAMFWGDCLVPFWIPLVPFGCLWRPYGELYILQVSVSLLVYFFNYLFVFLPAHRPVPHAPEKGCEASKDLRANDQHLTFYVTGGLHVSHLRTNSEKNQLR